MKVAVNNSFASGSVAINSMGKANRYISLYPNPTVNIARLQLSGLKGDAVITISSITGKMLWYRTHVTDNAYVLPVENLPAGLYIVTVKDAAGVTTLKLVKAK